jgi:hypothetical protein
VTKRKRQFAAGRARNQEVSGAAVEVMEEAPGYNLTGRQAYNLAGVAGLLSSAASAPALAVIAPAMYSESGLRVMNSLMRSRPDVARRIGDELTKRSAREGSITAVNVLEAYNKATQAEAGQ